MARPMFAWGPRRTIVLYGSFSCPPFHAGVVHPRLFRFLSSTKYRQFCTSFGACDGCAYDGPEIHAVNCLWYRWAIFCAFFRVTAPRQKKSSRLGAGDHLQGACEGHDAVRHRERGRWKRALVKQSPRAGLCFFDGCFLVRKNMIPRKTVGMRTFSAILPSTSCKGEGRGRKE